MAALIIALGACLHDRISTRSRAKRERNAEYAENFEELKAENAKRVRGFPPSNANVERVEQVGTGRGGAGGGDVKLPRYEDVVGDRGGRSAQSGGVRSQMAEVGGGRR